MIKFIQVKVSAVQCKNTHELIYSPLQPIAKHYIDKYQMQITGTTLSIEIPEILDLINLYDHIE